MCITDLGKPFQYILPGIYKTTGITLGHNILILMEILLMSSMRNR